MQALKHIVGPYQVLDRAEVDTDQIIPSRFLRSTSTTGYARGLFADLTEGPEFQWLQQLPVQTPILVTGPDFGIGSSREHAVWALQEAGFQAVIAERFGDIFRANALGRGLLAAVVDRCVVEHVFQSAGNSGSGVMEIDLEAESIKLDGDIFPFEIPALARSMLLNGRDPITETLTRSTAIEDFESTHAPPVQLALE